MVPNTSEENRRLNRRVDIVLLTESAQKAEPLYQSPTPGRQLPHYIPKGVKLP
jgi:hypothetical protein